MSTHDYVLANQVGSDARVDLNLLFQAIVSQNSSATEPTTMYAYMFWFDTTAGYLKQRNAANSAWEGISIAPATTANHAVPLSQTIGRNLLDNASGWIYQRAIAATADDTYFSDRWYALTQTGTVLPSLLSDPEDGYTFGNRLTQSQVVAQRFGYAQIVEGKNCKHGRGSTGVFVPRVRVSTSQAVRYAILGWTGTVDTVTSDVVLDWTSASYTAGGFFLAASVSVLAIGTSTPTANTWTSLPSISGALGSTFNNLIVMVWTEGTAAQNFTLDFDFNQAEISPVATAFEKIKYEDDLEKCQKYLPCLNAQFSNSTKIGMGYSYTTALSIIDVTFPVTARTAPTGIDGSSVIAPGEINISNGAGAQTAATAISLTFPSQIGAQLTITATGTPATIGQGSYARFNTTSGKILFTGCDL